MLFVSTLLVPLSLRAVALVVVFATSRTTFARASMTVLFFGFLFFNTKEAFNAGNDGCKKPFFGWFSWLIAAVLVSVPVLVPLSFPLIASAILLIAWTLIFRSFVTVIIVLFRTIPIAIAWPPTTWALLFWFVLVTYI